MLALLGTALVLGVLVLTQYSAPRADAEAARVASSISETLESYDTAGEYRMDALAGSHPELPPRTVLSSEGEGLLARTTVRAVASSRCVEVMALPSQSTGPLQVEDITIAAGPC